MRIYNLFKNRIKSNIYSKPHYEKYKTTSVWKNIHENKTFLQEIFSSSDDIIYRSIYSKNNTLQCLLVSISGMFDKEIVNEHIIRPITETFNTSLFSSSIFFEEIKNNFISTMQVNSAHTFDVLTFALLSGNTLLFVQGCDEALIIDSGGWEKRNIEEPISEKTITGSREGFVETLHTNISLIRRRIRDIHLSVEILKVGRRTKTEVSILYLKGVVQDTIVDEIKDKIKKIDIDGIVSSPQIEQLIERYKWTPFPQILSTERVDKAVGNILEGRVLIIVDGSPFVLITPVTFASFFNSPDDYNERTIASSVMRIIRYFSFFLATTLPGLYLALTAYHPGMIPTPLVLTITSSRIGLPFPTFLEVLLMEFTLEILTEASIRLPKNAGQAVSIVGGLVIGQSAVQAGIVSPLIIIVVSLTALSSYTIPVYTFTLSSRMIRFPLIIIASILGLYGIVMAWIFLLIHLASINSFGIPYLGDFSPYKLEHFKDTMVKIPQSKMYKRPEILEVEDINRQK